LLVRLWCCLELRVKIAVYFWHMLYHWLMAGPKWALFIAVEGNLNFSFV
jgi:hypothetical protein